MANIKLDEAQVLLACLQNTNSIMNKYIRQQYVGEISVDLANEVDTLSDCIGMYANKLEKILAELNAKGA